MNLLCPICNKKMKSIKDSWYALLMCPDDGLYCCPNAGDSNVYGDDYLLTYELYSHTSFGKKLLNERWKFVLENFVPRSSITNILDYGCGANAFINSMPAHKFNAKFFSYDPIFRKVHDFTGVKIDILTCWDSFEHILRLENVRLINAEHVFVGIPIFKNDNKDITRWKHFRPKEHIWCFNNKALIKLFKTWNYKIANFSTFENSLGREDVCCYYFRRNT